MFNFNKIKVFQMYFLCSFNILWDKPKIKHEVVSQGGKKQVVMCFFLKINIYQSDTSIFFLFPE